MNEKKKVVRLSATKTRRLQDYVLANKADLEANPREYVAAAEGISKTLGFEVTVSNLRSACEVMEVRFLPSKPGPLYGSVELIESLRNQNAAILARLAGVEGRLARIERDLGLPAAMAEKAGSTQRLEVAGRRS